MKNIGRNDPCHCGSGKKYKKCCLIDDEQKKVVINSPKPQFKINSRWVKSPDVIDGMRLAGAFNGELMDFIRNYIKPGISTEEIDKLIHDYTRDNGHIPACLNYRKFPKSCCTSTNEVVCHGIPSKNDILKDGDIINIDLTTIVDGCYGDQSETFFIGNVSQEAKDLTKHTANAMIVGMSVVKPGENFAAIGAAIQKYIHPLGYSIVRDYTGHGIGQVFHEDPQVFHFRNMETAHHIIGAGMTFTIEPMINLGTYRVELDKTDHWTVRTKDRKLSAQFEHTILVTETGFEILTLTPSLKNDNKIAHLADHPLNKIV